MPANRNDLESDLFWFQSTKRHPRGGLHVGAGHAREQKGTGIGSFLVPERKMSPAWRPPTATSSEHKAESGTCQENKRGSL